VSATDLEIPADITESLRDSRSVADGDRPPSALPSSDAD
jgi:hypothetical protein